MGLFLLADDFLKLSSEKRDERIHLRIPSLVAKLLKMKETCVRVNILLWTSSIFFCILLFLFVDFREKHLLRSKKSANIRILAVDPSTPNRSDQGNERQISIEKLNNAVAFLPKKSTTVFGSVRRKKRDVDYEIAQMY